MAGIYRIEKDSWYVCTKGIYNSIGEVEFLSGKTYLAPADGYLVRDDNGLPEIIGAFLLEHFRPWSVQDAKPGDFLTYSSEEHKDWYFIYHSEYKPYECHYHYYAGYAEEFLTRGTACLDEDCLRPSTPKERDLLLRKIEEAGYRWDAESRKLSKTGGDEETHREESCVKDVIQRFDDFLERTAAETGSHPSRLRQEIGDHLFFDGMQCKPDRRDVIQVLVMILRHDDEGIKDYVRQLIDGYRQEKPAGGDGRADVPSDGQRYVNPDWD